ncbi:hypothetical protein AAIH70_16445 [Neorhizobium sp. BT27B]|uniref:hypothetical protein n=1 Tax=Neorhizobium sp. BT27B TaxID=3142625 RepID=UPI003D2839C5
MTEHDVRMPDGRSLEEYLRDYGLTLDKIASGQVPTETELVDAPLVVNWFIEEVFYTSGERHRHIFGYFEGHPFILDGTMGKTSPLLQLDRGRKWARCRSRIYKLGEPLRVRYPFE